MASAGDATETPLAHVCYILAVAVLATSLPAQAYAILDSRTGLAIGAIGVWRYGWGVLHFLRSIFYRTHTYPSLRRKAGTASRAFERDQPLEAYFLVTSYKIPATTTVQVYRAAFAAAISAPGPATVVASIVERSDQQLIKSLFSRMVGHNDQVQLVFVRIPGTGKRDALAFGFRAIARLTPQPDAMVAVIDGDSIVPPDLVAQCEPFFSDSSVGALTTDEVPRVHGSLLFRKWYEMRFAQRHVLMSSMGLSRRVLTLTGRMSMFRAEIICDPTFIAQLENDVIVHPRHGRLRFLTGDDKSSWFWLLRHGYQMLYVPDLVIVTVENPPFPSFLGSVSALMKRWFGNMLRTNSRALALGPRRIGYFVWWAILDQRLSMWTCLVGLTIALLATAFISPFTILVYAVWVLSTRYILSLLLLSARNRISILTPLLLYFSQIYGSLIKIYVFFHLDRQRWTRQDTIFADHRSRAEARLHDAESAIYQIASLIILVTACSWVVGLTHVALQ